MKQLFIFLFILIFISNINAQTNTNKATVKFGPESVIKDGNTLITKMISAKPEQYFFLGNQTINFTNKSRMVIVNAGRDLRFRNVVPLVFQGLDDIDVLNFLDIYEVNDNIYVFGIVNEKKEKNMSLYMLTLDKEELIAANPRKLGTINYDFTSYMFVNKFQLSLSQDSSKILIFYPAPYKTGMPQKFGAMVFDKNMSRIWANEFELPYADEDFVINKFFVTNNGQIVLNGTKYEGKNSHISRAKQDNYSFVLLVTDEKGQNLKQIDINVNNRFINELSAGSLPNNDIVCVGLTSSKNVSKRASGYFYAVVDHNDLEIKKIKTFNFSPELIAEGFGKYEAQDILNKSANGEEVTLDNYTFKDIFVNDNGDVIAFAEQTMNIGEEGRYYYDILVFRFSPEGEIKFLVKIPKRQKASIEFFFTSSFLYTIYNDNIYLLYNENIKNLITPQTMPPKAIVDFTASNKDLCLALCTIDPNGNKSVEVLFTGKESEGFTAYPVNSKVMAPNKIALFMIYAKMISIPKYKIAIVDIK
jgi:hypothetical protein